MSTVKVDNLRSWSILAAGDFDPIRDVASVRAHEIAERLMFGKPGDRSVARSSGSAASNTPLCGCAREYEDALSFWVGRLTSSSHGTVHCTAVRGCTTTRLHSREIRFGTPVRAGNHTPGCT